MTKIVLQKNSNSTGTLTLDCPNTNSTFNLNLPNESGTVLSSASGVSKSGDTVQGNLTGINNLTTQNASVLNTTVTNSLSLGSNKLETWVGSFNTVPSSNYVFVVNGSGYGRIVVEFYMWWFQNGYRSSYYYFGQISRYGESIIEAQDGGIRGSIDFVSSYNGNINQHGLELNTGPSNTTGNARILMKVYKIIGGTLFSPAGLQKYGEGF